MASPAVGEGSGAEAEAALRGTTAAAVDFADDTADRLLLFLGVVIGAAFGATVAVTPMLVRLVLVPAPP